MNSYGPVTILACFCVQWLTSWVGAQTIFCPDPGLCISKRFLRFGRAIDEDPYVRLRRQFFRFGRAFHPYQDKRFLRFGRSDMPTVDDYLAQEVHEPLYRKRRSVDTGSEAAQELESRHARSAENQESEAPVQDSSMEMQVKDLRKRDAEMEEDPDREKRFMRFGKRFMRFGRAYDEDQKRFMRFGRLSGKRFMRFGKRPEDDKRFMRFGKRFGGDPDFDDDEEEESLFADNDDNDDYSPQKRFMRFGKSNSKRFMRFGKRMDSDDDDIDMAKRFMRFGRNKYYSDKRFMRFGKRKARSADSEAAQHAAVDAGSHTQKS